MIEGGRVVFSDTMDAFNNYVQPHSILMRTENPPPEVELLKVTGVSSVEFLTDKQARIYFEGGQDITERLAAAAMQHGWKLREIGFDKGLLDDTFKQLSTQAVG
jgi:ABC-2 type transport system ATP-binding protein